MSPLPEDWPERERPGWDDRLAEIVQDTFGERIWRDSWMLDLFHDSWINRDISRLNRGLAREQLDRYAYEDYDLVFEDEFDFDEFFEWMYPPS